MTSCADTNRVLIIEDDRPLAGLLADLLRDHGYEVDLARDGAAGLRAIAEQPPDLVLLDLLMPRMDGYETCRAIREVSSVPILVVSGVDDESAKVRALDLGADDYVTKPFGSRELLARLRAALRRRGHSQTDGAVIRVDERLVVDRSRCMTWVEGQQVDLSPIEYRLLLCFLDNPDRVLTHQALLTQVWGWEYVDQTEYVKVAVHHLRQKIEPDPHRPRYIVTHRGIGYRLDGGDLSALK